MISSTPTLCYLNAASHSGSTLLAMLLNSNARMTTIGELKLCNLGDLKGYRCSCRELIADCSFWSELGQEMSTESDSFDLANAGTDLSAVSSRYAKRLLKPLHRGIVTEKVRDLLLSLSPAWRCGITDWANRNRRLIAAVAGISNSQVVVDSSKVGVRLKYLLRAPDMNVKVIRLVRDGRAVALTYMREGEFADASDPELRGGGTGKRKHRGLSMAAAAEEWRRSNEEASVIQRSLPPEQHMQIRYEDLCADVGSALGDIAQFLNVPADDGYLQFKDVEHHVVGNGMRLDGSSEVVLDERWRSVLTEDDLAEFDRVAGSVNRSLGYD